MSESLWLILLASLSVGRLSDIIRYAVGDLPVRLARAGTGYLYTLTAYVTNSVSFFTRIRRPYPCLALLHLPLALIQNNSWRVHHLSASRLIGCSDGA